MSRRILTIVACALGQEVIAMKFQLLLTGVVLILGMSALAADQKPKVVEMTGTLRTGIVAIGGETSGIVIETRAGRFDLDLGKNKELRRKAAALNGKKVTVAGTLVVRKGVELKERRIIVVRSMKETR
jgi:hypothetical protein